jgi:hypothetical protein
MKIKAMLRSRRFWISLSAVLGVVAQDLIGMNLNPETVAAVGIAAAGWVIGDSIKTTE